MPRHRLERRRRPGYVQAIRALECRGYISGPVFALQAIGKQELACAGPVEIIKSGGSTTPGCRNF
jgi:hypothetical protein